MSCCGAALPRPASGAAPSTPWAPHAGAGEPRSRTDGLWHDRLLLLLESTGEGVYGIDMQGRCTFINRAGAELLGYAPQECLGRDMHTLVHHRHADGSAYPAHDCPILHAFQAGVPCRVDSEVLWRRDGTAVPVEYSSYPILDGGLVCGAVVTFVDISERQAAQAALRRAHEELEQRVAERTAELTQRTAQLTALTQELQQRRDELTEAVARLRELSAYTERVREDERTRIAREVHDELGALLVALKMDVGWIERRLVAPSAPGAFDPAGGLAMTASSADESHRVDAATESTGGEAGEAPAALDAVPAAGDCADPTAPSTPATTPRQALRAKCQAMRRLIDAAVVNVGRIITDLRPSILDHQGLWAALEWQAQEFIEATELRCDLRLAIPDGLQPDGDERAMAIFRIFQEMLTNVARHARAHSVRIRGRVGEDGWLQLDVLDDGVGAPQAAFDHPRAWGVLGMRERAGHFGGTVELRSEPGGGTLARLRLPLSAALPAAAPPVPAPSAAAPSPAGLDALIHALPAALAREAAC
jgi:PAS domain S-box-containing protein